MVVPEPLKDGELVFHASIPSGSGEVSLQLPGRAPIFDPTITSPPIVEKKGAVCAGKEPGVGQVIDPSIASGSMPPEAVNVVPYVPADTSGLVELVVKEMLPGAVPVPFLSEKLKLEPTSLILVKLIPLTWPEFTFMLPVIVAFWPTRVSVPPDETQETIGGVYGKTKL